MAGEFNAGSVVARLKLVDDGFGSKLKQAFEGASTLQKGMMAAGAAAVTMGVAVAALTKQAADYTDKLGKLAQQIGMTTEQISSFALAASLSDLSTEEFGKSVSQLNRKMVDAASGNAEAAKSFQQLGLSVKNSNGTLKSSEQMLEEIADKFAGAKDSATKTALAMDLMGRAGAQMIPLLNGGAKEIKNVRDEAQRMGLVFSQDAFKAAEQFNDAQTRIGQSLIGLRQQIAETIISLVNESGAFDAVSAAIQSITQWWMELDTSTKETIVKIVAATAAFLAVAGAIAAVSVVVPVVIAGFTAMMAAAGPIVLIAAAFAGVTAAIIVLTAAQKDSLAVINRQKSSLEDISKTYTELGNKIDLTEDETKKLADADAALEKIAKELGKTIDLTNKSLDEKRRIMQEMRQDLRLNIFENWTNALAQLVDQAKGIQSMRDWILKAKEAGSTEANNPFLKQQIQNLQAAEFRANTLKKSLDELFKKFEEFDKPSASMRGTREIAPPPAAGEQDITGAVGGGGGAPEPMIPEGALGQVQQWGDRIFGLMSKLSSDAAQIAQNNLTKISNFASLWVSVYTNNLEKAHEAEREQLQAQEDEKLNILRAALDTRLMLINEEFAARKAALEAELVLQKQGIDAMTAQRIADAEQRSVDTEERMAAVRTIEEDGERQKEEADKEHQARIDAERQKFQGKATAESKKATDEFEAEKKASAKRMMDLEKRQADEKKDISKNAAAFEYTISLASFRISQQQAAAQAKIQYAQALMSALTTGMQMGPIGAMIAIPALMGMATMAFASSMAAIASTPPPMPPAELFMQKGGMVPGPLHSQGGVKAELEGGEYVMPRGPAMANLGALEAMRDGRMNGAGGITVIVHVGSLDPAGRSIDSVGRELGLSVRSHL